MSDPIRETIFGATPMKDECMVLGCGESVEAACAYSSSSEHDVVVVWLCSDHGSVFRPPPGESRTHVRVQQVSRTCRGPIDQDGPPCGAYATEAIIIGGEFEGERQAEIRIISVCAPHAAPFRSETFPPAE